MLISEEFIPPVSGGTFPFGIKYYCGWSSDEIFGSGLDATLYITWRFAADCNPPQRALGIWKLFFSVGFLKSHHSGVFNWQSSKLYSDILDGFYCRTASTQCIFAIARCYCTVSLSRRRQRQNHASHWFCYLGLGFYSDREEHDTSYAILRVRFNFIRSLKLTRHRKPGPSCHTQQCIICTAPICVLCVSITILVSQV